MEKKFKIPQNYLLMEKKLLKNDLLLQVYKKFKNSKFE